MVLTSRINCNFFLVIVDMNTRKSNNILYEEISHDDFDAWLEMSQKLWTDYEHDNLKTDLKKIQKDENQKVFIAKNNDDPIGFINLSIRTDYVEGSDGSPTGYLEGIFVEKNYRKQGIAKQLIEHGQEWLRSKKCSQIGSDTWLTHNDSQQFHKKVGFWEEERLVHFLKDIN